MSGACRLYALAAASVVLAGCGSSPSHTVTVKRTSTTSLKRAEFVAKADAICTKLKEAQAPLETQAAALEEAGESSSRRSALAALMHKDVGMARGADAKLAAIPRPPGSEATIEKLLAGYSQEATELGNLANAIEAVDGAAIQSARAELAKAKAVDRGLAEGLGLKACSRPHR